MRYVVREGTCSIDQLAAYLDVSPMTIYRDVGELERAQLVVRRRGEIHAAESSLTEAAAQLRLTHHPEVKRALGLKVREHMAKVHSVAVDDSSSVIPLVEELGDFEPITVVTNAEFIASRVRRTEGVRLLMLGGDYEAWAESYFGEIAEVGLEQIHVDLCVMSMSAVTTTTCYHPNATVARFKRKMLSRAQKKILLVDSTKFTRSALHKVTSIDTFDVMITDDETPGETIQAIEDLGVKVEVVHA